jgi:hypothetical protein
MDTVIPSTVVLDVAPAPVVSSAPNAEPAVKISSDVNWWLIGGAVLIAAVAGYIIYQNTQKKIIAPK